MKVFAISDLHLDTTTNKPMDIFGDEWIGYKEIFQEDWKNKVTDDDLVLLAGDLSWAMTLEEALPDFELINSLPGKKVVVKGNHDFYWSSLTKIRNAIPQIHFIQNDCVKIENYIICGSRLWNIPEEGSETFEQDKKIYLNEIERFKMSINAKKQIRKDGDKVIVMFHFPPFDAQYSDSPFTDLCKENKVDKVIYGHLHGKNVRVIPCVEKDGIPYYLTSADLVHFKLTELY